MNEPKLRFKADDGSDFPNWEARTLDTLMSFKNGINASGEKFGKGIKCISVMDILNNSYITYDIIKGYVDIDEKTLHSFSVEYGDVVFQRSSENVEDAGRANVYMDKEKIATFSGFVIRGKRKTDYEPLFMNALMSTFFVRKQIMAKAQGAQHINIGQEMLNSVVVIMPRLPEQQKIADFLSAIDTVIEKQQATAKAWEQRKKGVMQKLFNQEVRFKADDGSDFPDWEEKRFGDIVKEFKEKTTIENEDTLLSCAIDGIYLNSELFGHQRGQSNIGYLKIKQGTLILSAQNLHLGNVNVNMRFKHGIISPAYKTYQIVGCNVKYMNQLVKWDKTKQFFYNATTVGASGCRRNVDWMLLYQQVLKLPSPLEQQKIADCLSALDDVIKKQKEILEKWKELKKGLLQQMFV